MTPDEPANINLLLNTVKICLIAVSALSAGILIVAKLNVTNSEVFDAGARSGYFILTLLTCLIFSLAIGALRGRHQVTLANVIESVPLNLLVLIGLVSVAFLCQLPITFSMISLVYATSAAFVAAISLIMIRRNVNFTSTPSSTNLSKQFREGGVFALITGATVLNTSIDTLMVGHFLSLEKVGYYNVALKLAALVSFSLIVVSSLYTSRFSAFYHQQNFNKLKDTLYAAIAISSVMALVLFVLLVTWQSEILNFWGAEFNAASTPLLIVASAQLINVFFGPIGALLTVAGQEKPVLKVTLLTLTANALLNYWLVPSFGLTGAASATAFAIVCQNLLFCYLLRAKNVLGVKLD